MWKKEDKSSSSNTDNASTSQFSPSGRISQVEYAKKAVGLSGTAIGLQGKDGVIFAVENLNCSKLQESKANSKIFTIDLHIGVAVAGIMGDAKRIVMAGQQEAAQYVAKFGTIAPLNYIKDKLSLYMHSYTLNRSFRPLGASILLGAYESQEPKLYCMDPSGSAQGYFGCAVGKAADAAMEQIESLDLKALSITALVKQAARIIYAVHDDDDNEDFELQLSWIGDITEGRHEFVPSDVRNEAENYARDKLDATHNK